MAAPTEQWQAILRPNPAWLELGLFFLAWVAVHLLFAVLNAAAFNALLAPRISRDIQLTVLLAQLILVTAILHLGNSWLYPDSTTGHWLIPVLARGSGRLIGSLLAFAVTSYLLIALIFWLKQARRAKRYTFGALVMGATVMTALTVFAGKSGRGSLRDRPDIIVIGVDSLRPDHLQAFDSPLYLMPHLEGLLKDSVVFNDTLTTQPHTFPATVSILTGRWPNHHGGRDNLYPPSRVATQDSVAYQFRAAGYRTLLAMDETRFANIDQRYGFDRVIGPPMGIVDFVMSLAADNVLVNLIAGTPVGGWLFPAVRGNRALDYAYQPATFSDSIDKALADADRERPLFFYAHYCGAHWPYRRQSPFHPARDFRTRHAAFSDSRNNYLNALAQVDDQIGRLLAALKQQGRLDNAIMVLLSDHGEDFGMRKDRLHNASGDEATNRVHGHGGSAFRAPQVQVLLAFRQYGRSRVISGKREFPASLIDVAPTLAQLAGLPERAQGFDGVSLAPQLAALPDTSSPNRIRFVESSYFPKSLNTDDINEGQVANEMMHMFRLDDEGRVVVDELSMPERIRYRQRAVYLDNWILAIGASQDGHPLIIDRRQLRWWPVKNAPTQAPVAYLKQQACLHWRDDHALTALCQ
ncbi:sulfatase-like hydrolase/transferase [Pseudoxanthomonas dokdonensis]|uniref:sulfatase-like hydrolase/transferase n=1 Tax=Pseudoxanthomonas dokdonensis TaxID=344882 RepID=UPI001477565A|nr:sulfatase-like hydrolase/transferase [Pseudoxanthomonas dokdonensis]